MSTRTCEPHQWGNLCRGTYIASELAAYTLIVRRMLSVFRAAFPVSDPRASSKAQVILNLCVGGMLIARTTDDPELRRSLRAAALDQALQLLGKTRKKPSPYAERRNP